MLALLVLGLTAAAQALVFLASGSVALLADLIHNVGDASTAVSLGVAFALRSALGNSGGWAGLAAGAGVAVLLASLASGRVAGYQAIDRLIDPQQVEAFGAPAATA